MCLAWWPPRSKVKVRSIAGSRSGKAAEAATAVATGTGSTIVPNREQLLRALPNRTALPVRKSVAVSTASIPGWADIGQPCRPEGQVC